VKSARNKFHAEVVDVCKDKKLISEKSAQICGILYVKNTLKQVKKNYQIFFEIFVKSNYIER